VSEFDIQIMKYTIKALLGAAAIAAATLTTTTAQASTHSATWTFSDELTIFAGLEFSNGSELIDVTVDAAGSISRQYGYDPVNDLERLLLLSVTLPVTSSQPLPSTDNAPIALGGTVSLTSKRFAPGFAYGGTLSISNISIDASSQRVYASITGNFLGVPGKTFAPISSTSVSTVDNFHLFDYADSSTPLTFSGLTLTQDGQDHFISALRLYSTGANWLRIIGNHGDLAITPVPEPSTWGLMLAGMGVLVAAQRVRREAHVA
jgi:hypothetical protein